MPRQVPVVGEPFKPYVKTQIDHRQTTYGSGLNSSRSAQDITYLNSRTSWVKMASSVEVLSSNRVSHLNGLTGTELAKKGVLFNGLSSLNPENESYSFKSGVATGNSNINNSAYGFGGTEFGIQPMPGIIGFDITHQNRGSIRSGTIKLKAYNKFQFDLIELLYLRLGFTVMVEWGHSHYLDSNGKVQIFRNSLIDDDKGWFGLNGSSHLEMLNNIDKQRTKYYGNYDAVFGKVVNFSWNFATDGSYDISIQIVSLGDVVESFKVNRLSPTVQTKYKPSLTDDDKQNVNAIHQILKGILDKADDDLEFFNNSFTKEFVYIKDVERSQERNLNFSSDPNKQVYIRFDVLIDLIRNKLIPTIVNNNNCSPLFYFDIETSLRMKAIENLISLDPRVCIIKPELEQYSDPYGLNEYMKDFYTDSKYTSGVVNNIYLNFDFLNKVSSNNTNSKGEMSIFTFLQNVLGGVNKAFGNLCNLETIVYEDTNCLSILDTNLDIKTDENGNQLPKDTSKSGILQIYGFRNNVSNFVKNYSIETQISNELANMLTIGATANNSVVNEESTLFSKWNQGLKDRFQQSSVDGFPDKCNRKNTEVYDPNSYSNKLVNVPTTLTQTVNSTLSQDVIEKSNTKPQPARDFYKKVTQTWYNYISRAFQRNGMSGEYPPAYFEFNSDFIEEGKEIFKNHYITYFKYNYETTGNPSSTIGFIPIELSLDLDGISGLKIYNELRIDTKFLPKTYPDTMEFIVTGVDHSLENNEWVTKIRALSKPATKPPVADRSLTYVLGAPEGPLNESGNL